MMFQSHALFPHTTTVEQNIAFGLKQDKLLKAEITSRQEMLALVHMQEFAKRKLHQPGGQRQRGAGPQPGEKTETVAA